MPTASQIGRTTAEYSSGGGLTATDLNSWARGFDLGPAEPAILGAILEAVNARRLTSPSQITRSVRKRQVSLNQGTRKGFVTWYEYTNAAGPVRASFDLGDEAEIQRLARDIGGSFDSMRAAIQREANEWSATNLNRSNAMSRVARLALDTWARRAAEVYRLGQQTGRADQAAAEQAQQAEREREAWRRSATTTLRRFSARLVGSDDREAEAILARAAQLGPDKQAALLGRVAELAAAQTDTAPADVVDQAAAELAAADPSVLDALYPLAGPDYYLTTLQSLPVEWALIFAPFVVPDVSLDGVTLPAADWYIANTGLLDRPWGHLLMHLLYSTPAN